MVDNRTAKPVPSLAPPWLDDQPESRDAWAGAPKLELTRSTDGRPLRQRTTVSAAWLGDVLLVRFECDDIDAWGTHTERDAPLWKEEAVEVFLAPGGDPPTRYVEIEVSPRGALFDAWIDNPDGERTTLRADPSWDCPGLRWAVGARDGAAEADDWWAEIAIPLRSVLPEPTPLPTTWRANFYRIERPRIEGAPEEYAAWSPTRRDPPDFHVPTRFGRLLRSV